MTLFTQNGKNDSEFQFGNIMLGWFASPRFERRFLDNAIKSSSRIWEPWRKTAFYNLLQLIQLFSESFGHPSLCFIHVIKPDHPYFEHTKYEPDTSRHAREKWGVKIVLDFRTPCSSPSWRGLIRFWFPHDHKNNSIDCNANSWRFATLWDRYKVAAVAMRQLFTLPPPSQRLPPL